MAGAMGKIGWKIIGSGFAIPTGIVVRKALESSWTAVRGDVPPKNPAAPGTTWPDALIWAAASGVAVATARMVAARGAAATYEALTGHLPPGLESAGP